SEKRFQIRFKHRMASLPNPLELRGLRRKIALLKTLIHQKTVRVDTKETQGKQD
ncbi:MAG: 50S ribosomal protein L29, partial [Elusimicrobia bacterium]|nr:50S ribosomal protein L29 [Elusimicrobiota bacterium]